MKIVDIIFFLPLDLFNVRDRISDAFFVYYVNFHINKLENIKKKYSIKTIPPLRRTFVQSILYRKNNKLKTI